MSTRLQTVHVRINDGATGQATPVRLRVTDAQGNHYAPFGRLTEFASGDNEDVGGHLLVGKASYCHIDGTCEIALPPGPLTIEVCKGFEYKPLRQQVNLGPGKMSLRLNLERWRDLRAEGWYAGDGRAHFLSPHAALLEGAAEDVAVVNLLALHWQPCKQPLSYPNLLAFSGQEPACQRPGHLVVVNTLNTCPLGQLALLNCHRVVFPLHCQRMNFTMADWCNQCHRKGGLVAWPQHEYWPQEPEEDLVNEGLADLVLGKIDVIGVDLFPWHMEEEPCWYTLLNCGLPLPLLGSSRKRSNTMSLGCVRTYARLNPGEELTYKNWIEAVRSGRTFATNGPLLDFTVAAPSEPAASAREWGPGSTLELPEQTEKVRVRAEAHSLVPFERLEVVQNGTVVAEKRYQGSEPCTAAIDEELPVTESGWWAARCWGRELVPTSFCPQPVGAHTSPIYVQLAQRPPFRRKDALFTLLSHLERFPATLEELERRKLFDGDNDRKRLADIFESACAEMRKKLAT